MNHWWFKKQARMKVSKSPNWWKNSDISEFGGDAYEEDEEEVTSLEGFELGDRVQEMDGSTKGTVIGFASPFGINLIRVSFDGYGPLMIKPEDIVWIDKEESINELDNLWKNSNYGPHGESNQTALTEDTVFAPQKAGLLPEWVSDPHLHRQNETYARSNMDWWKGAKDVLDEYSTEEVVQPEVDPFERDVRKERGALPWGEDDWGDIKGKDPGKFQDQSFGDLQVTMEYLDQNELDQETMVNNILAVYEQSTETDYEEGVGWYDRIGQKCEEWSHELPYTKEQLCGVYAVTSPQTNWEQNEKIAEQIIMGHANGTITSPEDVELMYADTYTNGIRNQVQGYPRDRVKAFNILQNNDLSEVGGPKVGTFFTNFMGTDDRATVDVWATRIAIGNPNVNPQPANDGAYERLNAAYIEAGNRVGLSPRDMQAITWVAYRRMGGQMPSDDSAEQMSLFGNRTSWWKGGGGTEKIIGDLVQAISQLEAEGNHEVSGHLTNALNALEHNSLLEASLTKNAISVGDKVSWGEGRNGSSGTVTQIKNDGPLTGLKGDARIVGTEDSPVAKIKLESGDFVGHNVSSLKKTSWWKGAVDRNEFSQMMGFSIGDRIETNDKGRYFEMSGTVIGQDGPDSYAIEFDPIDGEESEIATLPGSRLVHEEDPFSASPEMRNYLEQTKDPLEDLWKNSWWRGYKEAKSVGDTAEWLIEQVALGLIPKADAQKQITDMKQISQDEGDTFDLDAKLLLLNQVSDDPMAAEQTPQVTMPQQAPPSEEPDANVPLNRVSNWWASYKE